MLYFLKQFAGAALAEVTRVPEDCDSRSTRDQFLQELKAFGDQPGADKCEPR